MSDNSDVCAICLDEITEPLTLLCTHTFCDACIRQWTATQGRNPRCPTCRRAYRLPATDMSDAVQFMSENADWRDFEDYSDPGPVWVEFTAIQARPWVLFNWTYRQRRDQYRHVLGRTRAEQQRQVYRYNHALPNPAGLFDHWRGHYINMDGDSFNRIAFYLANTGLARTDITSDPGDRPPTRLYFCPYCSRFVTSSRQTLLHSHICSTEFIQVTTHYDL